MKLIYAALLLHSAEKEINEENVKKMVDAAGIEVDDAQIKALVAALDGVNIEEAIEKAAMPVATAAPAAGASEGGAEEKKEEEKEEDTEKKAEEAAAGLGSLFG